MSRPDHFLVQYRPAAGSPPLDLDDARLRLSGLPELCPPAPPLHFLEAGPFFLAWYEDRTDPDEPASPFLRIVGNPYNVATSRPADIAAGKVWAAGELDGAFAAFAFDPTANQGALVTDRFGLVPIYRHEQDGVFTWSTSLPLLLALCRPDCRLDRGSVVEMLTLHMVLGDRTLLRDVTLVPPATVVQLGGDAPAVARYWGWDAVASAGGAAQDGGLDLVHETYALIEQAVLRGVPANVNRVALPLGGGLDSRLLAAVLTKNDVPVQAYAEPGKEAAIAREVARTLGLPLHIGPSLPAESIPLAHRCVDCAYPVARVRQWEIGRRAAREDGCEVLFDSPGFDPQPAGNRGLIEWRSVGELADALEQTCRRVDEESLVRLAGDSAREIKALVRSSLEAIAREAIDEAGPRAVEWFFMTNRLRKDAFGACLATLEHLPGRFPYLSTRLFEHRLRLPAELRRDQALYHRLFELLFPDLARIPVTASGGFVERANESSGGWRRWLESALRWISRGRLSLMDRGSFEVEFRRRGPLQAVFLDVLTAPDTALDDILPAGLAARAVESHLAGRDLGALLQGLYTVKHFLVRIAEPAANRLGR